MLEAVIFDMDGVIVDSEAGFNRSKQQLLQEFGVVVDDSYHDAFIGTTSEHTWSTLKQTFNLPGTVEELIQKANTLRAAITAAEGCKPIAGVLDLIRNLHNSGLKLAVASSSPLADIHEIVTFFEVDDCFQTFVSATQCARSKPFPDVFLAAAEQLGVFTDRCLVIEDSRNGLLAAKAAGMVCIAFANPDYVRQDQKEADRIVEDFSQLTIEECHQLLL